LPGEVRPTNSGPPRRRRRKAAISAVLLEALETTIDSAPKNPSSARRSSIRNEV
jgi:hypothetical protein